MSATDTGPGGRIEEDLEQPIKAVTRTHRGMLAGAPLGVVAVLVLASVAFGASVVKVALLPAAEPTAVLVAGADPTDEPTAIPTAAPTAEPTAARPTTSAQTRPIPTAAPPAVPTTAAVADMGALTVADNLDLTVSFGWNAFTGSGLTAYAILYENTSSDQAPSYPASHAWGTTPAGKTALTVPGIPAGDYQVRAQALCGSSDALVVCGQTSVAHVHLSAGRGATPPVPVSSPTPVRTAPHATSTPTARTTAAPPAPTAPASTPAPADGQVVDMGGLTVTDNTDRTISFSWHAYTGSGLIAYAVFAEEYTSGRLPTYPVSIAWRTAPRTATSVSMTPPGAGTFNVRLQALCGTGSDLHVCGQTAVVRIHLSQAVYGSPTPTAPPAPTPAPTTPAPTTPAPTATPA